MTPAPSTRLGTGLAVLLLVLAVAAPADARLGGGESFKRGGSSSKGSSGGSGGSSRRSSGSSGSSRRSSSSSRSTRSYHYRSGGGANVDLPMGWVCLGVLGLVVFVIIISKLSATPQGRRVYAARRPEPPPEDPIDVLRRRDPGFSRALFLDFAVLLYARAQAAAGKGQLGAVRPWLAPRADLKLMRRGEVVAHEDVCVGKARIGDCVIRGSTASLHVDFEATFVEKTAGGATRPRYARETWAFERSLDVVTKAPETVATFACPSCGARGERHPDGRCTYCGEVANDGKHDWVLAAIHYCQRQDLPALDVGGPSDPDESSTRADTIVDPRLAAEKRALMTRYPGFSWQEFEQTVTRTFLGLQGAWTARDWAKARPLETDAIFQTHRFWMERYRKAGITNVLDQVRVNRIVVAKIERDAWFEAITVRVYASMIDWKREDATGRLIAGHATKAGAFSEYWTFVRRSGFDPRAASKDPTAGCPACGARVPWTPTAECSSCGVKVTTGQYGWVLSRIDQVEAYEG